MGYGVNKNISIAITKLKKFDYKSRHQKSQNKYQLKKLASKNTLNLSSLQRDLVSFSLTDQNVENEKSLETSNSLF